MASHELWGAVAPAIAVAAVAAGFAWQMMRRKTVKPKVRPEPMSWKKDPRTGLPIPNDDPAKGAEKTDAGVERFRAVGVKRPTMLAVTAIRGEATAAELFIQRAFKIDRPFWRPLDVSFHEKRNIDCLFSNVNKLAWVPGSAFERHFYAVSFSPVLEEALHQGFHPRVNATAADLQICAIDETGTQLGEPMLMPDHSWGEPAKVHALWCALNPTDKQHDLEPELKEELRVLGEHVESIVEYVSALSARNWQIRFKELTDLADDLCRLGAEAGPATERHSRTNAIEKEVDADSQRIDKAVKDKLDEMRSLEEADQALVYAKACIAVRELIVRFKRILAILRVIGGDTFEHELQGANNMTRDLENFPDVRPLIEAATHMAHEALSKDSRSMNELDLKRAGEITRHAKELVEMHDTYYDQLKKDVDRVQAELDRCLVQQTHQRRFAVRVDDAGHIEEMYVLDD